MTNPSKQRGTAAETAVVNWLRVNGHEDARRNPPGGAKDVGDIGGVETPCRCVPVEAGGHEPMVVEVKAVRDLARGINEGLAELEAEKRNADTDHGVLVIKRRGTTDPGRWLAVRIVAHDPELGGR